MRHGSGNRRQRGRNNSRRGNNNGAPNRSQVFDSNGPDVRIRGTAHQIVEKYSALAKDASSSGDHTLAENYLQHAEHYQRIINTWDEIAQERAAKKEKEMAEEVSNDEAELALPASVIPEAKVEEKETETA